ncbi:GNAT family protein [Kordia sp.]|nr:GNAT family protein [Kordia sp.]MCH2196363.1 GNAT family N-acetyltransferase [Kordia sp.]
MNFRKEAHFKQSLFIKGTWVDDVVYAVLKSEWNDN